jgi:DNA-binding CsgD family transcriptional regulator
LKNTPQNRGADTDIDDADIDDADDADADRHRNTAGASARGRSRDPSAEAARTWMLVFDGRTSEAWEIACQTLGASGLPPDAVIWATAAAVLAAGLLGRHEDDARILSNGLAVATAHVEAHPSGRTVVAGGGCLALVAAGRLHEARRTAEQGHREAVDMAAVLGPQAECLVGIWTTLRGVVARAQGRVAAALADLTEVAALPEDRLGFSLRRLRLAELATAHALAGDHSAANRRLDQLTREGGPPSPLFDAWVERASAWVSAGEGHLSHAAAHAQRAAELAQANGQPMIEALALYDTVRFGGAAQARVRLIALAGTLRQPVVSAMATAAANLRRTGDGHCLDEAASALAGCGHLLYAAEAALAAYRNHARAGRTLSANASFARATALRQECGGARSPLLGHPRVTVLLTARELEIASLAKAGHSGPRIAEQLHLSIRTVNNHLGRVYSKLGVSGRDELAELLADQ